MTTKEVLIQARAELVRRGRARITLIRDDGRVCPLGAIGLVTGLIDKQGRYPIGVYKRLNAEPAVAALAAVVPEEYDYDSRCTTQVWDWADSLPGPEDHLVLEAFDRAIARA